MPDSSATGDLNLSEELLHSYKCYIIRLRRVRRRPKPPNVFGDVTPDEIRALDQEMAECRRQNLKLSL